MRPSFWQHLDLLARRLIPVTLSLLLLLLAAVPLTAPGFLRADPMISVLCVYYWAVHRPDMMGYVGGFTLGLLEDILMGTPMGVSPLVLLVVQWVIVTQYRFFVGKPFMVTWWVLGLVALVAVLTKAMAVALLTGHLASPIALAASYALTVLLYPPLGWLFGRAQVLLDKAA
ncbi:rod shape-determining protein MreD [Roseospira visakhapatnamensis]|uniref:Rod shape-determining protein MreD n=1 Tax=Roseospira visakhapatnamensis TaxID=390880 RepID=A0A7W6RB91_9PROT|nr:rod shape-determining protein MreD [Roseospira visakhapatnamensis]MBB4265167.1 rod shape-determining protein MreD [Roseospira visakhapatnamensis]